MHRTILSGCVALIVASACAEEIPKPAKVDAAAKSQLDATAAGQKKQSFAPNEPLPAQPYDGDQGLTVEQLSKQPGPFRQNVALPPSVPGPVLLPYLTNVPLLPPYVSPAFVPPSGPPLGDPAFQKRTASGDARLTETAVRVNQFNAAVQQLQADVERFDGHDAVQLKALTARLEALKTQRKETDTALQSLPSAERERLIDPANLDVLARRIGDLQQKAKR